MTTTTSIHSSWISQNLSVSYATKGSVTALGGMCTSAGRSILGPSFNIYETYGNRHGNELRRRIIARWSKHWWKLQLPLQRCIIALASILEAREARDELRRRRRHTLRRGEPYPNPCAGTPSRKARKIAGVATTRTATDDKFSFNDDDDEPPPAEKHRRQPPRNATRPFEISESSSDTEIVNDPLPALSLPYRRMLRPGPSCDEDSGDDLVRAAPAKGKACKGLDNDDEDSDANIRPIKKTMTTTQTTMTESSEKHPAGAKLASKLLPTKPPPKKAYATAVETRDGGLDSVPVGPRVAAKEAYIDLSDDDGD
ncbi:hypothetical protein EDB92DRAFT_1812884 [Lactarius akahatsu]|uniref:Uncharacterized protein n=1 Tax=Lactarius akahatsu TaxID=416441 RepID=A0AAD4QEY5_9AGAM|nr:hypothetical protein EDB92DRAFT_1812884 [Lactarius akahatsu]